MKAHKYPQSNHDSKTFLQITNSTNSNTDDHVLKIFIATISLQTLYLIGSYFKIAILTSTPVFFAQILAPATIIAVASTWRRALKFSFLSSLAIPIGVSLILILAAVVSSISKPDSRSFAKYVGINLKVSLTIWAAVLVASVPAIVIGFVIRTIRSLYRLRSTLK